jgi:beta-1,4-mannosyl-glycoprotein beta-1,4-N-acetylglucosaminyltransferase
MEAGYCNRKKTDGICESVCDSEVRHRSGSSQTDLSLSLPLRRV